MLKNFLTLTFRNLLRQMFSSFVNITGLALGFASFILIGIYVFDEGQYDLFHEKGERIFRLSSNTFNEQRNMAQLPVLFYAPLKENVPEIEEVIRINGSSRAVTISYEEHSFLEKGLLFVDTAFFDVFSFEVKWGSIEAFKSNPYAIIITQEIASKYFGEADPLGKLLNFNGFTDFEVAGVMADVPRHSHLQFSMLVNYDALHAVNPFIFMVWGNFSANYYVLLKEGSNPQGLESKLMALFAENYDGDLSGGDYRMQLQNLKDIYMGSGQIESNLELSAGSQSGLYIFSASALFILLLACFNYVNLASAKSNSRAREVGMRKVLGAGRKQLVGYFLCEAFLVSLVAMILGIGLVEISLPYFSDIAGKQMSLGLLPGGLLLGMLAGLVILVSIISGLYPALVISRFEPALVLKGSSFFINQQVKGKFSPNLRFRQLLIILQFAISIGLVAGSLILFQQTKYVMANSGFEKESLVVLRNTDTSRLTTTYQGFSNQMLTHPFITHVSAGGHMPPDNIGNQGTLRQPHQGKEEAVQIYFAAVDYNYFETLGAKMAWGRSFDAHFATDSLEAVILNRSAANMLGLHDQEQVWLKGFWDGKDKRLIGVVEDILFQGAHQQVKPTAFFVTYTTNYYSAAPAYIVLRFKADHVATLVEAIGQSWKKTASEKASLDYYFVDARYQNLYKKELQIASVARIFTILAVIIACLGLLGTTVYVMEARKKELGVRKVLGASSMNLAVMISLEFVWLILIALALAWPISYYFMNQWLNNFAYRIELSPWIFILSGLAGLIVALVAVNSLALNQSRKNPVDSLKYE